MLASKKVFCFYGIYRKLATYCSNVGTYVLHSSVIQYFSWSAWMKIGMPVIPRYMGHLNRLYLEIAYCTVLILSQLKFSGLTQHLSPFFSLQSITHDQISCLFFLIFFFFFKNTFFLRTQFGKFSIQCISFMQEADRILNKQFNKRIFLRGQNKGENEEGWEIP